MSCSHSQESGQRYDLAPDWPHESEEPIRSMVCLLTKLLTMTVNQKFPLQNALDVERRSILEEQERRLSGQSLVVGRRENTGVNSFSKLF